MDSGLFTQHVIETISDTIEPLVISDLTGATGYLKRVWLPMTPQTRDGIKATITQTMGNSIPVAIC